MMPSVLTKLIKGKIIDTQEGFVDTFNYLVDFISNLCGDGDTDKRKAIKLDRSVPDHPIIKSSGAWEGEGITVKGTDGTTATGNEISVVAGSNTNLTSSVTKSGNTISIAVTVRYV